MTAEPPRPCTAKDYERFRAWLQDLQKAEERAGKTPECEPSLLGTLWDHGSDVLSILVRRERDGKFETWIMRRAWTRTDFRGRRKPHPDGILERARIIEDEPGSSERMLVAVRELQGEA